MFLENWWLTTLLGVNGPPEPPLCDDLETDVLVIGGGAAGIAAAMQAREAGREVVLLERDVLGGSTTGRSSGFLTPDSELGFSQLLRRFGAQRARRIWSVPEQGIAWMIDAIRRHGLACDLVALESLFLARRGQARAAREEHEARRTVGLPSALYADREVGSVVGSDAYAAAVRYGGTFGVNALRYAQGMKRRLLETGVRVHESTAALHREGRRIRTHLGSVRANEILVCTERIPPGLATRSPRTFGVQTFLSVSEPLSRSDLRALFPQAPLQCWDSKLVYTYFRPTGEGRLLVGGGTLSRTYTRRRNTTPHAIERVLREFVQDFPSLEHVEFTHFWPGRIATTRDLLPTLARDSREGLSLVLGAPGLPWATFCGALAARRATGTLEDGDDAILSEFAPGRHFAAPLELSRWIGTATTFALNQAWAKFRQIDSGPTDPGPTSPRLRS